ncbi:MAG: manganese-dependent inorganic pyrophosphatase [Patescibacteria group bacterium]|nr:manganese-dependent inorganic pyrophosphatase [Patescibacteria group bacterium]
MIKIFGHKSPDTDSTCSPIVYAWYLSNKKNTEAEALRLGNINREAEYVLKKFEIETPKLLEKLEDDDKVIIIDTNNPKELPGNLEAVELIELIDHHKLAGGLSTSTPVKVTMRPIACSATIIWGIMKSEGNTDIPTNMAGLLVSAILSDTLKFTSPTTTEEDKQAAEELAKIAGIEIDIHAKEMFEAKSDLNGMKPKDILLSDSKIFELNGKKVRVSVLETTKPENAIAMKGDLLKGIDELKKEESLDFMFFFVVDILNSEAEVLIQSDSEKEIAEKAFDCKVEDNQANLPGVVSRKKQIIPELERVVS